MKDTRLHSTMLFGKSPRALRIVDHTRVVKRLRTCEPSDGQKAISRASEPGCLAEALDFSILNSQ